jgi:hypothetical protein
MPGGLDLAILLKEKFATIPYEANVKRHGRVGGNPDL